MLLRVLSWQSLSVWGKAALVHSLWTGRAHPSWRSKRSTAPRHPIAPHVPTDRQLSRIIWVLFFLYLKHYLYKQLSSSFQLGTQDLFTFVVLSSTHSILSCSSCQSAVMFVFIFISDEVSFKSNVSVRHEHSAQTVHHPLPQSTQMLPKGGWVEHVETLRSFAMGLSLISNWANPKGLCEGKVPT